MIFLMIGVNLLLLNFLTLVSFADEIDDLIPAIIACESGGRADAVSPKGAIGLMGISPIVFKEWEENTYNYLGASSEEKLDKREYDRIIHFEHEIDILYDKDWNKNIGEWYLRRLKDHYGCKTIEEILCAYNWGIGNLKKYRLKSAPQETKSYIQKVLKLYKARVN